MAETYICPANKEHGAMPQRERPTPDAAWCGTWYDCQRCHSSVLVQSEALRAFLESQRREATKEQQLALPGAA